ncbi:MAG: phosphodiester glycosidase family protein [Bacteroidales bacterium]|jgi:hypothetical protein|nr:phosphodiester glycosidase family protein [Bacteroidales bacterium]
MTTVCMNTVSNAHGMAFSLFSGRGGERLLSIVFGLLFVVGNAFSQHIVIEGNAYAVDTLQSVHSIGPGIKKYSYRLPEFVNGFGTLGKGLIVNVVEADVSRPDVAVEVCSAKPSGTLRNEERIGSMFARKTAEYAGIGRKPIAIVNGDFYMLGSAAAGMTYGYEEGRPLGMEVENGMLIQREMTGRVLSITFDDKHTPRIGSTRFAATVDIAGGISFPLSTVNTFAEAGELALFNNRGNACSSDSTLAWSPHNPSIMVSLSGPAGGWKMNERMTFTVTSVDSNVHTAIPANRLNSGGKIFNGEGAILVGNGGAPTDSRKFLENMTTGDVIGLQINVALNGQPLQGNKPNISGTERLILQNGQPVSNNWNETHPRTAAGYSQDSSKVYLVTVDGRQSNVSVGVTTRQLADILRATGACTAVNLDGGGSTRMVTLGTVANSPTEDRRVADALMVVSSALPAGNPQLDLSPKRLKIALGASQQIIVNTRDDNGNIVEYLPAGATYTVRGDIGSITSGGMFTAVNTSASGYIVVQYGAMKDSVQVLVRRPAEAYNANLKSVELSAGTLSPAFSPLVTSYHILFPDLPASLSIAGTAEDMLATVAGNLTETTVTEKQALSLTVTSENGTVKKYRFTVTRSPSTGMKGLPAGSIKIYPNPLASNKILHIDLDKAYDNVPVQIYNAAGAPVHIGVEKGQYIRIPLHFSAGVYLLRVTLDHQTKTNKVTINSE